MGDLDDLKLQSYDYELQKEYIAQKPTLPEHNAKLLVCKKEWKIYSFENKIFMDLTKILNRKTVIFFNETKVFKWRFVFENAWCKRKSGKELEISGEVFVYKVLWKYSFEALVSDDKNYKSWNIIIIKKNSDKIKIDSTEKNNWIVLKIVKLTNNWVLFEIEWMDIFSFLEKYGQMPLPPYIKYEKDKEIRYQTNFARELGSSAAPTASLHFTKKLLNELRKKKIKMEFEVLHVGLWTFRPVYTKNILEHKIHWEELFVNAEIFEKIMKYKKSWKKILAVGTTMTRFLESLPYIWKVGICEKLYQRLWDDVIKFWDNLTKKIYIEDAKKIIFFSEDDIINKDNLSQIFSTKLFIYPWFQRNIVDQIITNFHLPKSSLLMLVASWMGRKPLMKAYKYAINRNYKFYSFGDGMLIF